MFLFTKLLNNKGAVSKRRLLTVPLLFKSFVNRNVERPNKHFYSEWGFRREEVEGHWLEIIMGSRGTNGSISGTSAVGRNNSE